MIFERFYDDALAQASFLVGSEVTREATVVDPNMGIEVYVAAAARLGARITSVTETHIHADFASGAQRLSAAVGARLYVSGEGGSDWRYGFVDGERTRELHDGDTISNGEVTLTAMHTPGHTPEHMVFLVTDHARADQPFAAITGDFLFVGDVGRPDLLEVAAGVAGSMRTSASDLYRSLQKFSALPDYLQVWPGHGAGSACGKAMSSAPHSTLGYERIANWAFAPMNESDFIDRVLEGQPPAPPYFGAMKIRNRNGSAAYESALPRKIGTAQLAALANASSDPPFILDVRNRDEWDRGHLSGATLIPLRELAARLDELPRDRTILVHCQHGARSGAGAATLDANGFSDVHELTGGFAAWEREGLPIERA